MYISVNWDVKQQYKQTKAYLSTSTPEYAPANKKAWNIPLWRWCGASTYKICMETALFQSLILYGSIFKNKKLMLMLPF